MLYLCYTHHLKNKWIFSKEVFNRMWWVKNKILELNCWRVVISTANFWYIKCFLIPFTRALQKNNRNMIESMCKSWTCWGQLWIAFFVQEYCTPTVHTLMSPTATFVWAIRSKNTIFSWWHEGSTVSMHSIIFSHSCCDNTLSSGDDFVFSTTPSLAYINNFKKLEKLTNHLPK